MQLANQPLDDIPLPPIKFHPSRVTKAVNVLWFSSLILSLFATLFGIFVKQWLHTYSNWSDIADPREAVLVHEFYRHGRERWHVSSILATLPLLLQLALLFFVTGLVIYLWTLDTVVASCLSVLVVAGVITALIAIVLPVYYPSCPYKSPLGLLLVRLLKTPRFLSWKDRDLAEVQSSLSDSAKDSRIRLYKEACALIEISPTERGLGPQKEFVSTRVNEIEVHLDKSPLKLLQTIVFDFASNQPLEYGQPDVLESMLHILAAVDGKAKATVPVSVIHSFIKHVAETRPRALNSLDAIDEHFAAIGALASCIARRGGTPDMLGLHESTAQLLQCSEQRLATIVATTSGKIDHQRRWALVKGSLRQKLLLNHLSPVFCAAFSPDGTHIVSGSFDGTVRVWDASTGAVIRTLKGHTDRVQSVTFSPDGTRIVSGSGDDTVRVWDVSTGAIVHNIKGHRALVNCVAFSPDGTWIVSGSWDETVRVWDASTGTVIRTLEGHTGLVMSVAFSPDGTRIVSGSADQTVRAWDASTGAVLCTLEGHTNWVESVAFSPDGTRIVSGSDDKTVRVWDASTGTVLHTLRGHTSNVTSVAFSSDRTRIVSGSWDQTVRVWDANTGAVVRTFDGHISLVSSVAFSPNGTRIISGSFDQTVRAWDPSTSTVITTLQSSIDVVLSVEFSSDGTSITAEGLSGDLQTWNAPHDFSLPTNPPVLSSLSSLPIFSLEDGWIIGREDQQATARRLFWVVPERRGNMASHGHRVALGSDSGIMTLLDFTGLI
jgi:WD40 repeat protein